MITHHYDKIDIEIKQKIYTTCSIFGKKDALRVCTIFIFTYYYFPITNIIAYSFKYSICFISIIPSFYYVRQFRKGNVNNAYYIIIIILIINLASYSISLYISYPNVGDGSKSYNKNS